MNLTEAQLVRAMYSQWDFQQALSALTFLLEDCDFEEIYDNVRLRRFRCFETTLIISMARPLEKTRNGITLGLKAIGIKLSGSEQLLIKKVLDLRSNVIAHSSEDEMHFRSSVIPVLDGDFNIPHFQFNEGLHLAKADLLDLEILLRRLLQGMADFFYRVAQDYPELLRKYCEPNSLVESGNNA